MVIFVKIHANRVNGLRRFSSCKCAAFYQERTFKCVRYSKQMRSVGAQEAKLVVVLTLYLEHDDFVFGSVLSV